MKTIANFLRLFVMECPTFTLQLITNNYIIDCYWLPVHSEYVIIMAVINYTFEVFWDHYHNESTVHGC